MIPRKETSILATILGIILIGIFIVLAFVVSPLIALLAGIAIGYIIEFVSGDYVIQAFHLIGLANVQDGDLPKVFGLLALIAYFFKLGTVRMNTKASDDN